MNKKGFTLVELIVSMVLISILMLFMYNLLADITYDAENNYYAIDNTDERNSIINDINQFLISKKITLVNAYSGVIKIYNSKENYKITYTSSKLNFYINDTLYRSYDIDNASLDTTPVCKFDNGFGHCIIKVYTTNIDNSKDNNNTIDDIEFTFYS